MPLESPPGNTALTFPHTEEFISCTNHPLLHSQSWKTWKPAGRTDDHWSLGVLPTKSATGKESGNKAHEHTEQVTHSPGQRQRKHEFQRNETLTRTNGSPTTFTSCPRSQLHSNLCAQHLNYTLYFIPMRLNTWLPSCPIHRWRNWGLEKFSKLAMISWPPASNWTNLDSDQKPLASQSSMFQITTGNEGKGGGGGTKYILFRCDKFWNKGNYLKQNNKN